MRNFIDRSKRPAKPKIALVIPTKNEEENLKHIIPYIPDMVDEVIVVDGHSVDGTVQVAQELIPNVKIVYQKNKGKGSALSAGLCQTSSDIVIMIDADGSMDPREIPAYVGALLAGADLAKGTRFGAGAKSYDITPLRYLGNKGLKTLTNLVFKTKWQELAYGYAGMWVDILEPLGIDKIDEETETGMVYGHGFEIETLLFTRAHKAGLKVVEIASTEYDRINGESNLNTFKDGFRVLNSIFKEKKRKLNINATAMHSSFIPK